MKFQDKFYDILDHNKCPSCEKEHEKCTFRLAYFHRIQPIYETENMRCGKNVLNIGSSVTFLISKTRFRDYYCGSLTGEVA